MARSRVRHGRTNGIDTLVASSGQLWSVNATTEAVHRLAPAVFSVWALAEPRRLLFSNQDLAFLCVVALVRPSFQGLPLVQLEISAELPWVIDADEPN